MLRLDAREADHLERLKRKRRLAAGERKRLARDRIPDLARLGTEVDSPAPGLRVTVDYGPVGSLVRDIATDGELVGPTAADEDFAHHRWQREVVEVELADVRRVVADEVRREEVGEHRRVVIRHRVELGEHNGASGVVPVARVVAADLLVGRIAEVVLVERVVANERQVAALVAVAR